MKYLEMDEDEAANFNQTSTTKPSPYGNGSDWTPGGIYFFRLVGRLAHAMSGRRPFPHIDWRFNEFPNEGAHALYVTCVEVMALRSRDPAEVRRKVL